MFYGGWAFFANFEHGQTLALKAAITQGSYSFMVTLCLALMVEWLFVRCKAWSFHLWCVGLIACGFLYLSSWAVNAIAGTPNVLLTMLPGALMSTIYTVIYIVGLNKLDKLKPINK